jgi:MFS family permease
MSAIAAPSGLFRSLRNGNYRLWTMGAFVSNIGTWVQRTAQDWLVLTMLTHHSASAVGVVMALQFGPQMLLLPWTGVAADRFDQRRLLMWTQGISGALALGLGVLTLTGLVTLWQVYVFAFLFGCASAFDAPVRQTFVGQLVGDADLPNAVALNATSFNSARMIGPAAAGLIIAATGTDGPLSSMACRSSPCCWRCWPCGGRICARRPVRGGAAGVSSRGCAMSAPGPI